MLSNAIAQRLRLALIGTAVAVLLYIGAREVVQARTQSSSGEREIEVALFEGGYGIYWHDKIAGYYEKERAGEGIRVNLWGDPRVAEKIKPRLLRGDPPDVILVGGMPIWLLISTGKLHPFDAALDAPSPGSDQPWRDLFVPGILNSFTSDGHVYAVPNALGAWSCWYNAGLFQERGWEVPRTWDEFNRLCEQIRTEGIAPLAFQGKYPLYAWWTFASLIHRCGGLETMNRLNDFEPGAFTHSDVVRAAQLLQDMAVNHFQVGAMAMTHTESQLQFVNGKAAMIFCGVYLENEMKESTPPDFQMRCFNVPAVKGGKGNPLLFNGEGGEWLFLPADANYPGLGAEFCRYMISPRHAADMGSSIGALSPLQGATPREAVTPALQSVLDMMDQAPGVFSLRHSTLLLTWTNQTLVPELAALLDGGRTPEAFCQNLENAVQRAVNVPDAIIPPFIPYDPAQFGEAL
jgi:N-acetylglucosamine transport system substrate-binding protein